MFPKTGIKRIMENAGVNKSTEKAKQEMGDILWEISKMISERAIVLAKHAGRKTVSKEDIILAKREIWG